MYRVDIINRLVSDNKTVGYTVSIDGSIKRCNIGNSVELVNKAKETNATVVITRTKDFLRLKSGRLDVKLIRIGGKEDKEIGGEANSDTYVGTFEILVDMVRSLKLSKYKDSYLIKGGFVLMSGLVQCKRTEYIRATTDINLDFKSLAKWEQFVHEVEDILTNGSKLGAKYVIVKRRGVNKEFGSDSLKFEVEVEGSKNIVGIDMNIKEIYVGSNYRIPQLQFTGASYEYMLMDKLTVLSSSKLPRRIKDLYDVYVISKTVDIGLYKILEMFKKKNRKVEQPPFVLDGNNIDGMGGMRHAYEKQAENRKMELSFDEVYSGVLNFTTIIFQALVYGSDQDIVWYCEKGTWM